MIAYEVNWTNLTWKSSPPQPSSVPFGVCTSIMLQIGFSFVDHLPFKIRQAWQLGWNHFLMMETLLVLIFRWTSEGCRLVHRCYQAESLFGHLVCQEGKVSHQKLVIYVSACYSLKELKLHWQDLRKFKRREGKEKYTLCISSCVWLMGFAEAAI